MKKTVVFSEMLNKLKNAVADKFLSTTTHNFFGTMTKQNIIEWATTCMKFVYENLSYKKNKKI